MRILYSKAYEASRRLLTFQWFLSSAPPGAVSTCRCASKHLVGAVARMTNKVIRIVILYA